MGGSDYLSSPEVDLEHITLPSRLPAAIDDAFLERRRRRDSSSGGGGA